MSEWPWLHLAEPPATESDSKEGTGAPDGEWPPLVVHAAPPGAAGEAVGTTAGTEAPVASGTEAAAETEAAAPSAAGPAAEPEAPEPLLEPELTPEPPEPAVSPPAAADRREPDPELASELRDLLVTADDDRSLAPAGRLGPLLTSPRLLQRVVQKLASDAAEQSVTGIVALGPGGSVVAVPLGLELSLPVYTVSDAHDATRVSTDADDAAGDPETKSWQEEGREGLLRLAAPAPREGEAVYLVADVLQSVARWEAAVDLLGQSGASVVGAGAVMATRGSVEAAEDISNLMSLMIL